ncbi:MAG TPA: Mur ligase family protein [Rhizomicrobium sp.]|nr:Mur ligase family protein [Rhizomicrobium sp.]
MTLDRPYFFCGIGGSGMLPLALILRGRGATVSGSDRALDQGRTPEKFEFLRKQGVRLFPQDGSGVSDPTAFVVASAAVEDTIPDIARAKAIGATLMLRAQLLAELFNASPQSIGVAGTSGKSTTTGMIGWILSALGRDPTVMNGAVMKNFATPDRAFASALVGKSDLFVSEVDESDGSIARYVPHIAVVNNMSLDHKSMDELRKLFCDFTMKAKIAVLNLDNGETAALAARILKDNVISYSISNAGADLLASNIVPKPDGIAFDLHAEGKIFPVRLQVPGRHNVSNALAALAAVKAVGVPLREAAEALARFTGIRRRLEVAGTADGITVIDDFAHNPDKIAATLATLHDFPGRLLIMFQPQGFGPLRLMKNEFIRCFADNLAEGDVLTMPEPVYFGGTTDRSVSSDAIVDGVKAAGREAFVFADRDQCGAKLLALAKPGDRIVVMGARDDTLSVFAGEILASLKSRAQGLR